MNIKIEDYKIDAYLVTKEEDKKYLSGFTGSSSLILLTQSEKLFFTDGRYIAQSKEEVANDFTIIISNNGNLLSEVIRYIKNNKIDTLGINSLDLNLNTYNLLKNKLSNIEIIEVDNLISDLRLIKNKQEIENIKKAVEITDKAFLKIIHLFKAGITEKEIENELLYYLRHFGAQRESFDPIVAFGTNTALPHANPTNNKLKEGDMITLDFGAFFNGYASDMTRSFFFNTDSNKELSNIWDIVYDTQKLQIEAIKEGVDINVVDSIGRDYITKMGYGDQFTHGTGHGIGLEIHEYPFINKLSKGILKEGMIITIEPGIYIEGLGGVRIENDILVTKNGYEILNNSRIEKILKVNNGTLNEN